MNTLAQIFDWLLAASARASLLTVVVLIARLWLPHRVPARWRYALWLPVLIVLLMPAFPESAWSAGSIIHSAPASLAEPSVIQRSVAFPALARVVDKPETTGPISWRRFLCLAWLAGAVGAMLWGIAAGTQTLCRFKRDRRPVSDGLQRELALLAGEIGLRRAPRVWMAPAIRSPAVTGLLRPTLLLPAHFEETLTAHEARLVLQHELTHIQRGDLPLHALLCLLLALHWFNPVLWLAFFKARLDRETACDAQVLDGGDQAQRVAYGHTLLKVETAFGHHGLNLGFVGIFQRGTALRARIQSIATPPHPHPLMKIALTFGIALLTFLGVTKAATADPKTPRILIETKFIEISDQATQPAGGAPLPAPLNVARKVPGPVAVLTDPQFQTLIRGLNTRKGVDLLSAPKVTTRPGLKAEIEIVREFAYQDKASKGSKPAVKKCGVTFTVLPTITAGDQLDLDLSSQIVEFEGFVNHRDGRREPIFTERKTTARVTMPSGETLILEMAPRTDKQLVEDTDGAGHVIRSATVFYHRRTLVFVSAAVVDPATGQPRIQKQTGARK